MRFDIYCHSCGKHIEEHEKSRSRLRHKECGREYNYCTVCGQPLTEFNMSTTRQYRCRDCESMAWYSTHSTLRVEIIGGVIKRECECCHEMFTASEFRSSSRLCFRRTCAACSEKRREEYMARQREYRLMQYEHTRQNVKDGEKMYLRKCCGRIRFNTSSKFTAPAPGGESLSRTKRDTVSLRIRDRGVKVFEIVPGDGDEACAKCALYDYENECRSYDCTGHYLRHANAGRESLTVSGDAAVKASRYSSNKG